MSKVMSEDMYFHIVSNVHKLKDYNLETGIVITIKGSNGAMRSGYLSVKLGNKVVQVHQIIAVMLFGRDCVGKQINHKDGNKVNNKGGNLEVCTQLENLKHQSDNGLRGEPVNKRRVRKLSLDGENLGEYSSVEEASKSIGKGRTEASLIVKVCKGKRNTTYGYKWEYIDQDY